MVKLLTPGTMADSDMAGRGITRQEGRTGMNRRVTRRTVTITIVSTLLLGLLSIAAVAQVFLLAPAPDAARQERVIQHDSRADAYAMHGDAICPADCQLGRAGETDTTGGTTGSAARAAAAAAGVGRLEFSPGDAFAGAARAVVGGTDGGPLEFLPTESSTRGLPMAPAADGYIYPEVYGNDQTSSRRGTGSTGVGDIEYSLGDQDTRPLPSLAPDHEPTPQFGPQP